MKRLFIIVAGVVVLIGIAIGIYFLFFAKDGASLSVGDPFAGTGSANAPSSDLPTDGTVSGAGKTLAAQLVKITDGPVARGSVAFDVKLQAAGSSITTSTTSSTSSAVATTPDVEIRFIDRASGNVYSYLAHSRTLTRISNKTLPGVQTASWVADGSRAYTQFLASSGGEEHVNTYALTANGGDGYLLENDLDQVSVVGSSTLFTLFSGTSGSIGTIARADGSNSKTLFSSLLSSIVVHPTERDFFATNKASSGLDGYGFQISRANGTFTRILGPFRGLTMLPNPTGTALVYSYVDNGSYSLKLLDTVNRTSTALPIATLSEKCVWSRNGQTIYCAVPTSMGGNLPDDWYQGAVTFTDRIWKIDLDGRVATLIVDPKEVGKVSVDAINLAVDPDEDFLIFTDKHSGALYAYDL